MNKYSRDLQNIPRNFLTLSRSTDRVRFLNQKRNILIMLAIMGWIHIKLVSK